jgi:peroxiredoxin
MKRSKIIACVMLVVFLAVLAAGFYYLHSEWMVEPLAIGQTIAPVYVQTMNGIQRSTQSIFVKKSMVLFFSTACSHCQKELSDMAAYYPFFKDSITIAAISLDGGDETKELITTLHIPFPVYLDLNHEAKKSFHVHPTPAMFFVDEHQRLLRYKAGEQRREQLLMELQRFASLPTDSAWAQR